MANPVEKKFESSYIKGKEAISKLLKIVKAPSLRSDKGSVFGCYLTGSNLKLPFAALCEWHLCHFLNDF